MIRERFGTEHVVFESYVLVYPTIHNRRKIGTIQEVPSHST